MEKLNGISLGVPMDVIKDIYKWSSTSYHHSGTKSYIL